jgi:hypothetical protein
VDHQRFVQELPSLYLDWGQPAVRPRSPGFAQVLGTVQGMASPCVLQLLNCAVRCLEGEEGYAEVGCFHGSTLVGALLDHPSCRAFAADNFSEFAAGGANRLHLEQNLERFGLTAQVQFHEQDFEAFLFDLRSQPLRLGVYLYDGAHDYRSQLLGLLLAVPLLARRALLVIDDSNWPAVRQATFDFLAARSEARLLLDLPSPGNCHPTWWNGLMVLSWDAEGRNGYDLDQLRQGRQPELLESIYSLQMVNVKIVGNTVRVTPGTCAPGSFR